MSMLPGAPWLLAHRSMLKPNQPIKISLLGQDYVMWQDPKGQIAALPNACPHMGAMLSEGWCMQHSEGSAVVCPFHALEFDATGCTVMPGTHKKTMSLLQPLDLVIQGDFIWSYGGYEPQIPIPGILNEFAEQYEFIGHTADVSVKTSLLNMLLNMHDYNHQNGTHRPMFEIEEVQFRQFIDNGHHSEAYYDMPRKKPAFQDILKNLALLALPQTISAHLENHFPSMVLLHGKAAIGEAKQCHIFIPESETHTRTYVLMFGQAKSPVFRLLKQNFLNLAKLVVEQDAEILTKIYDNTPQKVKLNNEVGMNWVRRNFENFPEIGLPNLSR
jgi:phenylpropionate dioxygenase-like ring-hydroxylating dioxygenase large terminal subunit